MNKKFNLILNDVLKKIEPSKEDLKLIENSTKEFLLKLNGEIKRNNVDVELFLGGSFAKGTVIKKNKYDADVFLRFDKKYDNNEISKITSNLLKNFKDVLNVHGSRDYFRIKFGNNFFIEIVPVKKITKPEQANNTTDLSYSHVKYIKTHFKTPNILNEIKLAKAFCFANNCYGAESYVNGFSGYSIELLVYYYGNFLKFIKAMNNVKDKLIIDIEKHYKNKSQVLMDVNSSKLGSPIILIDPTFKQRNALAALSSETFERFKLACEKFLKNPSEELFELQKTDINKIKENARRKNYEFILIECSTKKQEGDIAGSKLKKFYNHLLEETGKFFEIKDKGFSYSGDGHKAKYFIVGKSKKEILINGPSLKDEKNVLAFKKIHKNTFEKKGRLFVKEKINFSLKEFLEKWFEKNKKKIKEMDIDRVGLSIVNQGV